MQYLLTESEHQALIDAGDRAKAEIKKTLQELCTLVADHMPVKPDWNNDPPTPVGCVLTEGRNHAGYCDDCPVKDVCPRDWKRWSQ